MKQNSLLKTGVAALAFILAGLRLTSAPIPFGPSEILIGAGTNAIKVYTYKPKTYQDGPVLFVFHGLLRNAQDYRDFAKPMAERFNALVAAPLFDTNRFPNEAYMRGGLFKDGKFQQKANWTFTRVKEIVDTFRQEQGRTNLPYYFIGHSGGGQFLMRLAAFSPLEARRIVASNPGSDLFPRRDWKYGYGFGQLPPEYSDDHEFEQYLAAPLTLYLGTADIDPQHPELDRSRAAELEGRFRLERGHACFKYAQELAREHGWKFNWQLVEAPGIAHDGKRMFAAPQVAEALFGAEKHLADSPAK